MIILLKFFFSVLHNYCQNFHANLTLSLESFRHIQWVQKSFPFWAGPLSKFKIIVTEVLNLTIFFCFQITALLICIVFNNTGERDVQNIQGAFSLIVAELIFNQMYYVLYLFPEEFIVFSNEKSLYDTFPYYLSKIISVVRFFSCRIWKCLKVIFADTCRFY